MSLLYIAIAIITDGQWLVLHSDVAASKLGIQSPSWRDEGKKRSQ